jgi:uncharacterized membrane protein YqgA involved in biofilm formation
MKGTLLNTATVAAGAAVGLLIGNGIPAAYKEVALSGLGLVTCGLGIKMFFKSHNALVTAIAVAVGGIAGLAIGIHAGIEHLSEWTRLRFGGEAGTFNEGLITSFVLFCIGPMTLLGCVKDGLEGDIELLALKSTMDGIAAVFLAATFGAGVLVTAALVLIFQGALTLLARPLRGLAQNGLLLDELTAAGGAILLGIGIHLLDLKDLHTANYLPALVLAPVVAVGLRRLERRAKLEAA